MKPRCPWAKNDLAIHYHDTEWGVPVYEDGKHFEFLVLESAQAGLSWDTVLKKRENYRKSYAGFNPERVATYTEADLNSMLADTGLIRNRRKLEASIENVRLFLALQQEFGSFHQYIWSFVNGAPVINRWQTLEEVPATSSISDALSKDLQKRGFRFVGSTIIYAHMQATGLINDHLVSCFRHAEVQSGVGCVL